MCFLFVDATNYGVPMVGMPRVQQSYQLSAVGFPADSADGDVYMASVAVGWESVVDIQQCGCTVVRGGMVLAQTLRMAVGVGFAVRTLDMSLVAAWVDQEGLGIESGCTLLLVPY